MRLVKRIYSFLLACFGINVRYLPNCILSFPITRTVETRGIQDNTGALVTLHKHNAHLCINVWKTNFNTTLRIDRKGLHLSSVWPLIYSHLELFETNALDRDMEEMFARFIYKAGIRSFFHLPPCNFEREALRLHPDPDTLRSNSLFLSLCRFLRE